MPHSGWYNHKTAGAKTAEIQEFATGSGVVINYESTAPTPIQTPDIPQALVYLDRATDEEIKSIPNINAELMGNNTQRTVSGRAIEARQRGGLTVQEPLMESHRSAKKVATKFLLSLIQQFVSVPQALRVLGSIAVRAPQGPEAQMMAQMGQQPGGEQELMGVLQGALDAQYDVAMTDQPWEPSVKREQYDALVELVQLIGPQAFPPEVLVEAVKDAGLLTEDKCNKILAYQQQMQQQKMLAEQAAQNGLEAAAQPPGPPTLQ
jgi:hypothetical protein